MDTPGTLTHEDVANLTRPFPVKAHEFKSSFCYVAEEEVTARLDEVDPGWTFEIKSIGRGGINNQVCIVTARLTVKGVSRESTGMQAVEYTNDGKGGKSDRESGEPEKGATTDALRRCARLFGVGRYILKMGGDVKNEGQLTDWLKKNYPQQPAKPAAPAQQRQPEQQQTAAQPVTVENRKPTPVPSTLTHFSDFPDKRQYVVNLAIENLFLETGDTWEDLLLLCDLTAETVRNIATGQELGKLVESKAMALFRKEHPDAGKPPAALPAKNGFVIVSEAVCLDGKAEFVADVGKLTVSRKRLIEMLEAGDVHEQFNGKAQIDAMNLREWGENGTALADCSHSFPPLKLVYRVYPY